MEPFLAQYAGCCCCLNQRLICRSAADCRGCTSPGAQHAQTVAGGRGWRWRGGGGGLVWAAPRLAPSPPFVLSVSTQRS